MSAHVEFAAPGSSSGRWRRAVPGVDGGEREPRQLEDGDEQRALGHRPQVEAEQLAHGGAHRRVAVALAAATRKHTRWYSSGLFNSNSPRIITSAFSCVFQRALQAKRLLRS